MDPTVTLYPSSKPTPSPAPYPTSNSHNDTVDLFQEVKYDSSWSAGSQSYYSPNKIADQFFTGLDSIGAWWKQFKNPGTHRLESVTSYTSAPEDMYDGYFQHVARKISKSDRASLELAQSRVPDGLKYSNVLSKSLGYASSAIDGVTGVLNLAETYHDEGYVGAETTKSIFKSVAQSSLGFLSGHAIGAGIASVGLGMGAAPVIAGIAGGAMLSYGIGRFLDYISS